MSVDVYSLSAGTSSLADPQGASAILAATQWMSDILLGPLATIIAVIAIAWVGLMMLSGRIDLRRGLTVALGCFILFGAPTIARGLRGVGDGAASESFDYHPFVPTAPIAQPVPQPPAPNSYDPYAGAALRP
jgi:type IV secretion system protein VirB2